MVDEVRPAAHSRGMQLCHHRSPAAFARRARPLYDRDPLRHTVALSVLDGLDADPASAVTATDEDETVVAALLRTARRPALVSGVAPAFAPALVDALADDDLPGAVGPVPEAEAFAAAWSARTGTQARVAMRMRLFALDELTPPRGVAGRARRAGAADLPVIAAYMRQFLTELAHTMPGPSDPDDEAAAAFRLGYGQLLWEVDGTPVALASARRPVAGMVRIGPVFTEPAHRGHGYAAAVTAAAARWALDTGARHVLLFTDAANAATNRLYPRVGFRFQHDALEMVFGG
jgi:GNAT superfamily N-acetyltransferase